MDQNIKFKETLKLLSELEALLPDLLEATSTYPPETQQADDRRRQKKIIVREKMTSIIERSRALQWATDCMPAADAGRIRSDKDRKP